MERRHGQPDLADDLGDLTPESERFHALDIERQPAVVAARADNRDALWIEVEANGFLYNMVRNIVGTLVEVGRGARPEAWVGEALAALDRRQAGPTAPPQGLFLLWVEY